MVQWICALGTEFWAGLFGAIVGGIITICAQWQQHRLQTSAERKRDEARISILKQMLDKPGKTGWRNMKTLSSVIGADRDVTARLLIEIGARGSESDNDTWAYIKDKPLPTLE